MLDIKWIRDNPEAFDAALKRRGLAAESMNLLGQDARRRALQTELQEAQQRRNALSKEIGAKKARGEDTLAEIAEVAALKERLKAFEDELAALEPKLDTLLANLPNVPAPEVPDGLDESANVELRRHGAPPRFDFAPKQHFDLGEALGLMDFERASKLSGARFVVLMGALARLERAIAQFMLDLHTREFGYTEVSPPLLVREATAFGTGNLPKFKDDLFSTSNLEVVVSVDRAQVTDLGGGRAKVKFKDQSDQAWFDALSEQAQVKVVIGKSGEPKRILGREKRWLIPTAEMPLTNLVADEIVDAERLPLRFTAYTPCFRAEAGAAGKDTRGMIRQHQFSKVELVSIAHPDRSDAEHERMTACAEEVLKRLGLHYRVVVLSAGDMGFAARKTYDIEVWLPGEGAFREISSCSNCGDFQARRMKARFREKGEKGTRFVHTLNGSGLAVGRTLIAVLENYQTASGTIRVPEALKAYMNGLDVIGKE
jgi:seryl-tRNA synthetase